MTTSKVEKQKTYFDIYFTTQLTDSVYRTNSLNLHKVVSEKFEKVSSDDERTVYVYNNLELEVSSQNSVKCLEIKRTLHSSNNHYLVIHNLCTQCKVTQFPFITSYDDQTTEKIDKYYDEKSKITIYLIQEINRKNGDKTQFIRLYNTNKLDQLLKLILS